MHGATNEVSRTPYLTELADRMEHCWPTNHTINLVCHGHSVPAGYFKTPVVDALHAYPHLLHYSLCQQFPHAVINVIVTAIGGENSVAGEKRFEKDVLTHRPDLVLIDYALNDRGIGLEKAKTAWSSMIQKALATNAKVILLTPTPDLRADLKNDDDPLLQHAAQIRQLAREFHVELVDSLALFQAELAKGVALTNLLSQVNHPNARGHELVASALFEKFAPMR